MGVHYYRRLDRLLNSFVQAKIKDNIEALLEPYEGNPPVDYPHKEPMTGKTFLYHNTIIYRGRDKMDGNFLTFSIIFSSMKMH